MNNWIKLSAAFTLAATTISLPVSATDANAQTRKSTYTDTASCKTLEEGEDRFTLRCPVPGSDGVHAILNYWDGRAYVAVELYHKPGNKTRLHTIADSASRVFGQKIEWRMREDNRTACAAIVRIYTTKAGILAVSDLSTGRHLGDARTNPQAHKLAETACRSNVAESQPGVALSSTVNPASERGESIKQAALRGQKAFDDVYRMGGISSAIDETKACYKKFQRTPSKPALAHCAAMDILGGNIDSMMAQGNPQRMQKYFDQGRATDKRIATGMRKLGLSKQKRTAFEKELAGTLGATLND
ncbi:hypothetical protein OIV19_22645 [Brucella sp. HL-2]|nr:hypothetical protein [Brucella sp. HL-2]MCV9910387.1 hypothetical protein [Brucella sp. HL-2]